MCLGLSGAQNLPNYFRGSFNIPNSPIPAPGGGYVGSPAAPSAPPTAYQSQAPPYTAAARPQWSAPASPARYAPAAPAYTGYAQPAPAAAPVSTVPSSYGWNVQHTSAPPPSPTPTQAAVQAVPAAPAQYRQYAASQPQQWQPQPAAVPQPQWQSQPAATPQPQWQPAAAPVAPTSPISTALLRPASVHYANIGESLSGDYKVSCFLFFAYIFCFNITFFNLI